jgi:glucose/arabinose dehydrogenase
VHSRFTARPLVSIVASLALVSGVILSTPINADAAPAGFVIEPVVTGLDLPVAVSFADDGRMFIAEKGGVIRVFRNGALLPTPFIDLSSDVNEYFDRGLVGMTLHPDFPDVPYVYVLYTYDPPGLVKDGTGARVGRLERISADPSNPDVAATGPGSRTVLLGRNSDASVITDPTATPRLTCWRDGALVEDCIPQDSYRHAVGAVRFGPDGALYVANGDADRLPEGPLDPVNHTGVILRLDPATGNGLPDNPFYDGDPTSNLSKTWAYGLRNPFRFGFDSVSGEMFLGDVGQRKWEAIHRGRAGMNYGWPCYEGGNHVYPVFQDTALCQAEYDKGPRTPVHTYQHDADGAGCVVGGEWYRGTLYPSNYRGAYFFADCAQGWVKYLEPDGSGGYTVRDFASGGRASGVVQIVAGPDTDLYWVSIFDGIVYRLRYTAEPLFTEPLRLSLGFDEGSGTVAADDSGFGNDAELTNGATWGSGRVGGALVLDGVDDVAAVATSASLEGFTDAFTVSAWVNRPTTQAKWRIVVSRQLTTDKSDQFHLSFFDGQPRFGINTTDGGNQFVGAGSAALGAWVHLAGVYDGSTIKLYVDGVERASRSKMGGIVHSTRPILIGGNANGTNALAATQNLAGSIDDVRVYAQALSGSEIAQLATPSTPPDVTVVSPAADSVVDVGTTVNFAATATDPVDGDLTDRIEWIADLHHNTHAHPDYLPPTTGGSGSFVLDDHGDDTFVRLCAQVRNDAGVSDKDCVDVRPTTTTVTIDSVPQGLSLSFEDVTDVTPFTVVANVNGTRRLVAPLSSDCYEFDRWSDGGAATHDVVIGRTSPSYTATYADSCATGNLLVNPGFESDLTAWTSGSIVTSPVHSGAKALQITARSLGARVSKQRVDVTGGASYQASGWIKVADIAAGARIRVQWRDSTGSVLRTHTLGTVTGTVDWTQVSASLTAPAAAMQAVFLLRVEKEADNAGQAWYDDLMLAPAT